MGLKDGSLVHECRNDYGRHTEDGYDPCAASTSVQHAFIESLQLLSWNKWAHRTCSTIWISAHLDGQATWQEWNPAASPDNSSPRTLTPPDDRAAKPSRMAEPFETHSNEKRFQWASGWTWLKTEMHGGREANVS